MEKNGSKKLLTIIWPYLIIIAISLVVISPQLIHHTMIIRSDTKFHYNRFYDAGMQLKMAKINIFQSDFAYSHSARIVNALYGPFFAYLNGSILLISKNWLQFQIISDLFINILGAGSMMYLLKKVGLPKWLSLLFGLIYINIGMIPGWITSSSFNGWGQAVMPLVVLCGVEMIQKQKINWLKLGTLMAILCQIHMLSFLLAGVMLIPFFIYAVIKTKSASILWIEFFKAVGLDILLTLNVIGAYVEIYLHNHLATPGVWNMALGGIRPNNLSTNLLKYGSSYAYIMPLFLILIIFQLVWVCVNFKKDILNFIVTIWGVFLLFIASTWFIWGIVQRHFPFVKSLFQFPFRIGIIAYPLVLLGIALSINKYLMSNKKWSKGFAILLLSFLCVENIYPTYLDVKNNILQFNKSANSQYLAQLNDKSKWIKKSALVVSPDYLPTKLKKARQISSIYRRQVVKHKNVYHYEIMGNDKLKLSWTSRNTKKRILPIVLYTQDILNFNKINVKAKINKIGNPQVKSRLGHNVAIITFAKSFLFMGLLIITIISWFLVLGIFIKNRIKV